MRVGDKIIAIFNGLDYEVDVGTPKPLRPGSKQIGMKRHTFHPYGQKGRHCYKKGDIGIITEITPAGAFDIVVASYEQECQGIKYYEASSKNWRLCTVQELTEPMESQLEVIKSFQKPPRTGRLLEIGIEE
jgi:hypothetical protein